MAWEPTTQDWTGKHAVLFVHGVGNAAPRDYDPLVNTFLGCLDGGSASSTTPYFLYYDDVNDWIASKVQLAQSIDRLKRFIEFRAIEKVGDDLGEAVAEIAGDVLFPVLLEPARVTIRNRIIAQIQQMRLDGTRNGVRMRRQNISIVCHSLGCFHTYEALHEIAEDPSHRLMPAEDAMQFRNVIFMASPVQMIRTVAGTLGNLVPSANLASADEEGLSIPFGVSPLGETVPCTNNWISITGNQDPVGGHLLENKADWAYMDIDGQESIVDDQSLLNPRSEASLAQALVRHLAAGAGPGLPLNNPHSWDAYITRHKEDLKSWFGVA